MMRYTSPELVSLNAAGSPRGNCVNGSGAANMSPCTTGGGDLVRCNSGSGNYIYCNVGTAATQGFTNFCNAGITPTTTCFTGTGPAY